MSSRITEIFKVSIPSSAFASQDLTSDNTNVADGATVTIGSRVYRFKSTPAQAYDIQIGADADTSLANLIAGINASGTPGTEYFAGTLVNTQVSAGEVAAHAFTVTALVAGASQNTIATTETSTHLSWGADTLAGGIGGVLDQLTVDSGAMTSEPMDVGAYAEGILFLTVHSHVGATGTLDVKLQMSADNVNWLDGDAMTQVTTTDSTTIKRLTSIFGKYLRAVVTPGGTAPEYKISLSLVCKS